MPTVWPQDRVSTPPKGTLWHLLYNNKPRRNHCLYEDRFLLNSGSMKVDHRPQYDRSNYMFEKGDHWHLLVDGPWIIHGCRSKWSLPWHIDDWVIENVVEF